MKTVAIYARYSSSMQSQTSIEDQFRLCEQHAKKFGATKIAHYSDHEISGASTVTRAGFQKMISDAYKGQIDIVLSEALDRLSRNLADAADMHQRLEFLGIPLHTVSEGRITDLHIGMSGTHNAMYLKELAKKTRRGLAGRVSAGRSAGGIAYGYEPDRTFTSRGEVERGILKPVENQIDNVVRIFRAYASVKSPQEIAFTLNQEGIPAPRGGHWSQSTINGNRKRGTGILNNELYIGKRIWNRQRFVKNPDTGKRLGRPNPEEEWSISAVPELRVINQDLWNSAKARQRDISRRTEEGKHYQRAQRPKLLLSFLLKCGCCGGGFSKIRQDRYGCSTAKNKGTYDNTLTIRQDFLEDAVLTALQDNLLDENLAAAFCEEYTRHLNSLHSSRNSMVEKAQKERAKLDSDRSR